ncbi:MAG TPA: aminotransferase class IV [Pirellulaceae bacterium]|nr:aminotransferase class IV [Pirellulaceae bacterium]
MTTCHDFESCDTDGSIHLLDFHATVIDGTRTFGAKLFQLEEHIRRMIDGAREIHSKFDIDDAIVAGLVECELENQRLKTSNNESQQILAARFAICFPESDLRSSTAKLMIKIHDISRPIRALRTRYQHGCSLTVVPQRAIPVSLIPHQIKSRGSSHFRRAELMAQRLQPGSWALLLHEDGCVSEGVGIGISGWNIWTATGDQLNTLGADRAVDGIAKRYLIDVARNIGLACCERDMELREFLEADEVFVTSSTLGIMPVKEINGFNLNRGSVWGKVSMSLRTEFERAFQFSLVDNLPLNAANSQFKGQNSDAFV